MSKSNPNYFENPPEYSRDKFSLWWYIWLSHPVLVAKLPFKSRKYNTVKLETQDQRFNLPKGNCSVTTIIVYCTVDECHMNFLCIFKLRCMYLLGKESHVFIWLQCREREREREREKLQLLITTTLFIHIITFTRLNVNNLQSPGNLNWYIIREN